MTWGWSTFQVCPSLRVEKAIFPTNRFCSKASIVFYPNSGDRSSLNVIGIVPFACGVHDARSQVRMMSEARHSDVNASSTAESCRPSN